MLTVVILHGVCFREIPLISLQNNYTVNINLQSMNLQPINLQSINLFPFFISTEVPEAPTDVQFIPSADSVMVLWKPGFGGNSPFVVYEVTFLLVVKGQLFNSRCIRPFIVKKKLIPNLFTWFVVVLKTAI